LALALTVPVFALEMGGHLFDSTICVAPADVELDAAAARHAGGAGGRVALLRARRGRR
jgi:hypothetical protein